MKPFISDILSLVESRTISHYRIEKLLGVGGMGEVYLARDSRLDRRVALKILPVRFTRDEERVRRFQREARAASALNHPNIITIYEIDQEDSTHFIATEYIAGKTLRERLAQGPLSIEEVLDIGLAVCNALSAAHEHGIIHRDIKPDNIMLRSDGYVKVLDFGLAKLTEAYQNADGTTPLPPDTDPGTVMGTLQYVSPEQARAQPTDSRADLFSLGDVLYEIITGRAPFMGSNLLDIVHAIVMVDPPAPSLITPNTPVELDRIVLKALAKKPDERYQSAKELGRDLRSLKETMEFESRLRILAPSASGAVTTPFPAYTSDAVLRFATPPPPVSATPAIVSESRSSRMRIVLVTVVALLLAAAFIANRMRSARTQFDSVAVLPFVNASGDNNAEYLSDGISESIIDSLSQLPQMQVTARSSVFRYKGKNIDPLTVGRELKVRAVVTGQLIQRGDTLIIRTSLIDVDRGTQIWGEQYDRKLADVLAVQEDIAREITDKLRSKLTGEEQKLLLRRSAENSEAFQLYLKGRYYRQKSSEDAVRRAIDYFNQAIEKDPAYALAYAGLADAWFGLSNLFLPPAEAMPKAREAAKRAMAIDDTLAEAHSSLAIVEVWYDWDFRNGEEQFRRAIALNPKDADSHRSYGDYLLAAARFDESIAEKRKAEQLDPLSINASLDLARAYFYAHRLDEATAQVQRAIELDDKFPGCYHLLAMIQLQQGHPEAALAQMQHSFGLSGNQPLYVATRGYINAVAGHPAEARAAIAQLKELSGKSYTLPLFLARVNAGLGENDEAMRMLEQCYQLRSESVVWLNVDPTFDRLRTDKRFQELLERVGIR